MRKANQSKVDKIRTKPGFATNGKPFDHVVKDKVAKGEYRLECIPGEKVGISRPIEVYRANRASG